MPLYRKAVPSADVPSFSYGEYTESLLDTFTAQKNSEVQSALIVQLENGDSNTSISHVKWSKSKGVISCREQQNLFESTATVSQDEDEFTIKANEAFFSGKYGYFLFDSEVF